MPGPGIEPGRPEGHGILSPERLPVPPPRPRQLWQNWRARGGPNRGRYSFPAGFAASTGFRSNLPLPSTKNTHSEALSQAVVCR